jgi:hypothetical protein
VPDTPSLTIIKRFTYRDADEDFSNTYHFNGTTPANPVDWKTLTDAFIAEERKTVYANVKFVGAYGYEAGNESSVWGIDYTMPPNTALAGTGDFAPGAFAPGDTAATIRWSTGAKNSRGKWIYCRKYMHGVFMNPSDADELNVSQKSAFATFAAKIISGTLPGSFRYSGPQGAVLSTPVVNPYLTTRTLKRRGKRPH